MQNLRNRVGQVFDYGDPSLFFYTNLYITSVTVNSKDLVNVAGTQATLYKVSVQAQQLDNATQAIYFIDSLFRMSKAGGSGTSYSTDTVQFDNVTSLNKSISNRWDGITQRFIATSITISISGEVWEPDNGSGEPSNPDRVLALFNKLDALMNAEQSSQGTPNTVPAGETLPSNADVHFFLNNISIGNWTSFTKQNAPNKGDRYWKQTTSLSMTAVFDLTGSSNNQPDFVDSRSITIGEESPKFTQLQVLNQGTVFKRIGTNPGKATVTVQRQFRDGRVFVAGQLPATLDPEPTEWPGFANSEKTRDSTETRGFTNRQIREYIATEKIT